MSQRRVARIKKSGLKRVGFWWSDLEPDLPHPRDFVDPDWDASERKKVIAYLKQSYELHRYKGLSWCRLGCPGIPRDIGSLDLTDGVWVFPQGFIHYVRRHKLKPPEAFLDHIRANDFEIPELS